ncbi:septation ring formation regulator EzrA [Enterococcus sp. HY326]|uniref:septation ring formation regulator EzrA n=1 Tax=Enterococcus sp. HY326 TaxID=2971265 RepID=UPI00223EAFCF|nr:septation ring formation regulator EzrA [Enterococcus sp. HY326]
MGSNVNIIIIIFIAVVVILAILGLVLLLLRRQNLSKIDELEKRKEKLFDLPVFEEVDDVKKMHMVGSSQNTFREWSQRWIAVSTVEFGTLETMIMDAEGLNNRPSKIFSAKQAIESANGKMDEMENEVEEIRKGLEELRDGEERNSLEVQKALDVYEELQAELKTDSSIFGPALSELKKQVKNIEIEFTQFVTLNTSGDPIEAREVLELAEQHTYELSDLVKRIPSVFEDLNRVFPDQVQEIEEAYKRMVDEQYKLPDDFPERIEQVKKRIENSLKDIEKTEVSTAEVANRDTASQIDGLYDTLEREMNARKYVLKNRQVIKDYIDHAGKNNRQLMIELDHTSQSYALNHNELGRARGFQTELDELTRRYQQMEPQINDHEIPYTEAQVFFKDVYRILDDIENQQMAIDDDMRNLRKGERDAQVKVEEFEFRLRTLKRYVEKQRLPGLPEDYLEFFYVTTDRIEQFNNSLNKIRIDMDEINQLLQLSEEDLATLQQKTDDLVDAAALTEQMLQYANRYRNSHQEIRDAITQTMELFNNGYRYQESLDTIGTALERVEPGAFQRIESFYFKNPDLV